MSAVGSRAAGAAPRIGTQLVLESPERVADGGGGAVLTWVPQGTVWAEVVASGGREASFGERTHAVVTHRVTLRAAPLGSPRRPVPTQRFRNGNRIFAILGVAEQGTDGAWLTAWVEEGVLS